jgi:hypothetical protein
MFRDQVKFPFKRTIAQVSVSVALGLTILITGCRTETEKKDVLSEEKMVKVLMEIYLAETKAGRAGIPYDSIKQIFPKLETLVFEKMKVSDDLFKNSMQYYFEHPKQLEHIYSAVVDSLNLKAQSAPGAPLAQ